MNKRQSNRDGEQNVSKFLVLMLELLMNFRDLELKIFNFSPLLAISVLQHDNILLGNGSSELIDLMIRLAPEGDYALGPVEVQYKEYENSCQRYGRAKVADDAIRDARVHAFVNPTNPTGQYLPVQHTMKYIEENCSDGRFVWPFFTTLYSPRFFFVECIVD